MKKIRFYDNDQTHIDAVKVNPDIECIKVNSQIKINNEEHIAFIEELRAVKNNRFFNVYVEQKIQRAIMKKQWPIFNYDQTSGMTSEAMIDLIEWAKMGGEVVIFDLDRTLIKTEGYGIFFRSKEESDKMFSMGLKELIEYIGVKNPDEIEPTIDDFILYICGGKHRLDELRAMFRKLNEFGVDIYVNSMNTACQSQLFREVLQKIIVVNHEVQCSDEKGGKLIQIMKLNKVLNKRSHSHSTDDTYESPTKKAKKTDAGRSLKKKKNAKKTDTGKKVKVRSCKKMRDAGRSKRR